MNRYTAAGVLADMRAGRHVLVLSETLSAARSALNDLAAELEPDEKAFRANGHERITGAGAIRFQSIRSGQRGMVADVVVIDADEVDHFERLYELYDAMRRACCGGDTEFIRPV